LTGYQVIDELTVDDLTVDEMTVDDLTLCLVFQKIFKVVRLILLRFFHHSALN